MMKQQKLIDQIIKKVLLAGNPIQGYNPETIVSLGQHLQQYIKRYQNDAEALNNLWTRIIDIPETDGIIYAKILVEFELLEYIYDGRQTDQYLQQILISPILGWRNQWYLFRQLQGLIFTDTVPAGAKYSEISWLIYEKVYTAFRQECSTAASIPTWIPEQERQQNFVIVTTSQLLSEQHAPTKTALDRCFILMQVLHKEILLINTAEQGADIGNILLYHRMQTNYKKILSHKDHIPYRGISIPFLQCSAHMPEIAATQELLLLVLQKKPAYIVNVGGNSLVTDLFSEIVPVLTIATVFSELATTHSQYQMIGRDLQEKDLKILQFRGKSPNHVISGRFTFALKEQTQALTRKLLGIPTDCFAMIIIGARIGREVTDAFANLLESLTEENCFPVFVGEMDYETLLAGHEKLQGHSVYLGSRSDVLAVMDEMDIYVNPKRTGGGSSVVEAMVKGVVPLTLPYGDVYVNAGDAFAVADYSAMRKEILHLQRDHSYYNKKAAEAVKKAEILMDSAAAFTEVLNEFKVRCQQETSDFYISVIVPCYNVQPYIRRCLDSLLRQTLGFTKIQLIIIDDASTDETLQILQEYEKRYPDNILLIPLEQNAGQGIARNIGLKYAQGDYVGFIDADDWIEDDMYEILYRAASTYSCEITACDCDRCRDHSATKHRTNTDISVTVYTWETTPEKEQYIFEHRADIFCVTKLYARQFLLEHNIHFAEGVKYEDHYFGMLVYLYMSSLAKVDQTLYHWYQNTQSTCMSGKYITDRIQVQQILFEECRKRDFMPDYRELLEYNLYEKMVAETIFYLRRQEKDTQNTLMELMQLMQQLGIQITSNRYYLQETKKGAREEN